MCDSKKISDLTREVDVLKNQLKKYVAAVQSLRKEPNDGIRLFMNVHSG